VEPLKALEVAALALKRLDCRFAVAGGLAANFFRSEPRLTQDVDLLLLADSLEASQETAEKLLRNLGYRPGLARAADLKRAPMMGKRTTPVLMVIGRKKGEEREGGVDVLLPRMAWVPTAVERAQHHLIDFGFAKLPTITIEDFILAKAFALRDNPTRYKDMDDLKAVFESGHPMDLVYLVKAIERYNLGLPGDLRRLAPQALRRAFRRRPSPA
jgi:predicted nucleotidyltransferase